MKRSSRIIEKVRHPKWLPDALESLARSIRLHQEGRTPERIQAWMLAVPMMRVFRAIYGSDRETLAAIGKAIEEDEAMKREVFAHLDANPDGCGDSACAICAAAKEPTHE